MGVREDAVRVMRWVIYEVEGKICKRREGTGVNIKGKYRTKCIQESLALL